MFTTLKNRIENSNVDIFYGYRWIHWIQIDTDGYRWIHWTQMETDGYTGYRWMQMYSLNIDGLTGYRRCKIST